MTNLFGFVIDGLDHEAFLASMRVCFVIVTLLGVWLAARDPDGRRAGRIVFWIGIVGHTLAWLATVFPLAGVYGMNASQDRENHLGWANVVALGFSPLRTYQVNHLHFEPVWPLLTAIASGFEVGLIPVVFQWAPLIVGIALLASIRFAWLAGSQPSRTVEAEAAFAALGALLLMAVPGDFAGSFRNPWALTIMLKPNHALGLVLLPLAALAISRAHNLKTRLFAGFVLQLVGWAFVIHMGLFVCGLAVFVALSWITKRAERLKDLIDAGTAVGANLLIVSPYLVMLVVAYPFLEANDAYRISFFSDRPIEGPFRLGILLALSAFGAWRSYQERGRLGRILATQWLTAHILWQMFPVLGLLGHAREQDEVFYWCRFWTGLFAGVGLWHGVAMTIARVRGGLPTSQETVGRATALSLTLLLPSLLPAWWDPRTMDQYHMAGRNPLPDWIAEPARFIRSTSREAVFAGDRNYAKWIAAYGARRVLLANALNLPNDHPRRTEIETALLRDGNPSLLEEGRVRYGIEYVLVTSRPLDGAPEITIDLLKERPHLAAVYDRQFDLVRVAIFKVIQPRLKP